MIACGGRGRGRYRYVMADVGTCGLLFCVVFFFSVFFCFFLCLVLFCLWVVLVVCLC